MTELALPPRQKDVLELIVKLTQKHGYPPSLAELAKGMGLRNRMTVHQHVAALKKKGLVQWEPGLNRSLRVVGAAADISSVVSIDEFRRPALATKPHQSPSDIGTIPFKKDPSNQQAHLPLVGKIAAGQPIDAVEQDEYLDFDEQYVAAGCYALEVKGDSMIEEGIFDGDYVIIKPNPSPTNGEIVVALMEDGSATLKRFYKENSRFRLQPANSSMEPIYVSAKEHIQIQGTLVGLFRRFS
jgi:repressor LexA